MYTSSDTSDDSSSKKEPLYKQFERNHAFSLFQQNDGVVFGKFVKAYSPTIQHFATGFLGQDDPVPGPDDLTNEGFLRLWKNRHKINDYAHASRFLFLTVRNMAIDISRSKKTVPLDDFYDIQTPEKSIDQVLIEKEFLDQSIKILRKEMPKNIEPVLSYYFAGIPDKEAAAESEINEATYRLRRFYALKHLGNELPAIYRL